MTFFFNSQKPNKQYFFIHFNIFSPYLKNKVTSMQHKKVSGGKKKKINNSEMCKNYD